MKKTLTFFLIIYSLIACSSENDEQEYESGTVVREEAVAEEGQGIHDTAEVKTQLVNYKIYKNEDIYYLEDFKLAGLKKPKEFPSDSKDQNGDPYTPNSENNYTGWFKSSQFGTQDIELRFYSNHIDAKGFGKPSADSAMQLTKKTVLGSVQVQAPIFGGYILTGNVVILCSKSIEVCDEIYNNIEK